MSIKRLIFISSIAEADIFLGSARPGDLCIALTPRARSYLLKNGVVAEDTTRYFTNTSHENALIRSKEIVGWIRDRAGLSGASDNIASAYNDMLV